MNTVSRERDMRPERCMERGFKLMGEAHDVKGRGSQLFSLYNTVSLCN